MSSMSSDEFDERLRDEYVDYSTEETTGEIDLVDKQPYLTNAYSNYAHIVSNASKFPGRLPAKQRLDSDAWSTCAVIMNNTAIHDEVSNVWICPFKRTLWSCSLC